MAVRMGKPDQRRPRHLEILQHTVIHQGYALRRHAFIIELVVAQKVLLSELFHRRVVGDAKKIRQDLFAYFFRKRLVPRHVFGGAFGAMAEDFVEKTPPRRVPSVRPADGRIV